MPGDAVADRGEADRQGARGQAEEVCAGVTGVIAAMVVGAVLLGRGPTGR